MGGTSSSPSPSSSPGGTGSTRSGYTYAHELGLVIPKHVTLYLSPEQAQEVWSKLDPADTGRISRSSLPRLFELIVEIFVTQIMEITENQTRMTHQLMSLRGQKLSKYQRRLEKCKNLLKLELMEPKTITYFVRAARIQGDFLEKQQFIDTISAGGHLVASHDFKWVKFNQFRPTVTIDENNDYESKYEEKHERDDEKHKHRDDDQFQARMRARTAIALSDDTPSSTHVIRSQQHIFARQHFVDSIKQRFAELDFGNTRTLHIDQLPRVLIKWCVPSDEDVTRMLQYILQHIHHGKIVTFHQYIEAIKYVANNRLPASSSQPPTVHSSPSQSFNSPTVVNDGNSTPITSTPSTTSITSEMSSPTITLPSSSGTTFRPACFAQPLVEVTPAMELDFRLIFDEIEARTNIRRATVSSRPPSQSTSTRVSSPSTATSPTSLADIPMSTMGKSREHEETQQQQHTMSVVDGTGILMLQHIGVLLQSAFIPARDVVHSFISCLEGDTFTIYDLMNAFSHIQSIHHEYVLRLAMQHEHATTITIQMITQAQQALHGGTTTTTSPTTSHSSVIPHIFDKKTVSRQNLLGSPRGSNSGSSPPPSARRQTVPMQARTED